MSLPFLLTPAEDLAVQLLIRHGSVRAAAEAAAKSYETLRDQLESARVKAKAGNRVRLAVLYLQYVQKDPS